MLAPPREPATVSSTITGSTSTAISPPAGRARPRRRMHVSPGHGQRHQQCQRSGQPHDQLARDRTSRSGWWLAITVRAWPTCTMARSWPPPPTRTPPTSTSTSMASGRRCSARTTQGTAARGETLEFDVVGSSLQLSLNDSLVAYANDSTFATGGVGMLTSGGAVVVSNFNAAPITQQTASSNAYSDNFTTANNGQLDDYWVNQYGDFTTSGTGTATAVSSRQPGHGQRHQQCQRSGQPHDQLAHDRRAGRAGGSL